MRTSSWISLLWTLGAVTAACYSDRPLYVATTPSGSAGNGGYAGTGTIPTGGAGTGSSAAGTSGFTDGCSAVTIFQTKMCALTGACHDARGSAANFKLEGAGWEQQLVGRLPPGGGEIASQCAPYPLPYLVAGSLPARGLLLDKLKGGLPPCGDQMPTLGDKLTATELDCVQRWANNLVATAAAPPPTSLHGCDTAPQIFREHYCSLQGACHDATGSAANLDLTDPSVTTLSWEARLVDRFPRGGGTIQSLCANNNLTGPYLVGGSVPARGLFLDKLRNNVAPPCGDHMPLLPPLLTDAELDCVQRWANQLTAPK